MRVPALAMVLALPFLAWAGAPADAPAPSAPPYNAHYAWADVLRVDPIYEVVSLAPACGGGALAAAADQTAAASRAAPGHVPVASDAVHGTQAPATRPAVATAPAASDVQRELAGAMPTVDCTASGQQQRRVSGYEVEYRYRGEIYRSQLDYDPGERLRVRVSVSPAD